MSFIRSAGHVALNRLISAGLGFTVSLLSARILTPAELGSMVASLASVALLVRFSSMGLGQSAQYFGAQETLRKQDFSRPLMIAVLPLVISSLLILLVFSPQIGQLVFADNIVAQEIFSILQYGVPMGMFHFLASLYVLGKKELRFYFWLSVLPLTVSVLVLLWAMVTGQGLRSVVFAWVAQYAFSFVLGAYILLRRNSKRSYQGASVLSLYEYGIKSFAVSMGAFLVGIVPVLTGNFFSTSSEVGFFAVAQLFSGAILLIYGAIGPLVFSYVGSMSDAENSHLFVGKVCRLTFMAFFAISLVISGAAPMVLPIVFGQQYAEIYLVVWFLLPGLVFSAIQRILENFLYGRSLQSSMAFVHFLTALIIIGTAGFLAPTFGAKGLASAASTGFIFSFLLTLWVAKRRDGLDIREVLFPRMSDISLLRDKAAQLKDIWKKH